MELEADVGDDQVAQERIRGRVGSDADIRERQTAQGRPGSF